jgi:hypothetical protein
VIGRSAPSELDPGVLRHEDRRRVSVTHVLPSRFIVAFVLARYGRGSPQSIIAPRC